MAKREIVHAQASSVGDVYLEHSLNSQRARTASTESYAAAQAVNVLDANERARQEEMPDWSDQMK